MSSLSGIFSRILCMILIALNLRTSVSFSVVTSLSPPKPKPLRVRDTKVAVDSKSIVAIPSLPRTITTRQQLGAPSHNVTLTNYMRLPVEQYVLIPMPFGSSLTRIESNNTASETPPELTSSGTELFELVIPNITFFQLTLQPVVYATVTPQTNYVMISSEKCILRGSPFIEKVKLNDRFDFSVTTRLTWRDAHSSPTSRGQQDIIPTSQYNATERSTIRAETFININVDVPRPFNSIPKKILEATGNAAVKLTLLYIQANFVSNLVKDYVKWATVSEYRKYRSSLSEGRRG
ncbi:hypothetical protein ACHAXH_009253 [Discostella pseudostelligera]